VEQVHKAGTAAQTTDIGVPQDCEAEKERFQSRDWPGACRVEKTIHLDSLLVTRVFAWFGGLIYMNSLSKAL
jgi:hypothetical protein